MISIHRLLLIFGFLATSAASEMIEIPAGEFTQGLNSDAEKRAFNRPNYEEFKADRLPIRSVTISGFEIGKFEITNEEFVRVLNQALEKEWIVVTDELVSNRVGKSQPLLDLGNDFCEIVFRDGHFRINESRERHPVVAVTWFGAQFHAWALNKIEGREQTIDLETWSVDFSKSGYRLPTEAEWEFAARGGAEANWFPWGDSIAHDQANFFQSSDEFDDPFGLTASKGTTPVGYFEKSANGYGLHDVSGNVLEWCSDWYAIDAYGGDAPKPIDFKAYYRQVAKMESGEPATDPAGPKTGEARVLRGGSWRLMKENLGVSMRFADFPERADRAIGFRLILAK